MERNMMAIRVTMVMSIVLDLLPGRIVVTTMWIMYRFHRVTLFSETIWASLHQKVRRTELHCHRSLAQEISRLSSSQWALYVPLVLHA